MRYFFVILCLLPFFASYSQVTIKSSTAKWFLEKVDECDVREKQNKIDSVIIQNLTKTLVLKNKLINSYKQDSTVTEVEFVTLTKSLRLNDKELSNSKRVSSILIGSTTGAIIGSVMPGVGTLTGSLIGGVCGFVTTIFKHKKTREKLERK